MNKNYGTAIWIIGVVVVSEAIALLITIAIRH